MMLRALTSVSVLAVAIALAKPASADMFKYTRSDGTVVYTDQLAELPPERRVYYNQQIQQREAARSEQERALGKEELERREAERKRAELQQRAENDAERIKRMAEIDARLEVYAQREKQRQAQRDQWKGRQQAAKKKLGELLKEFRETQQKHGELAMRADFTLLPGQAKEKAGMQERLAQLEKEIDATIYELDVKLPEDARKAGIPPGWLR